LVAGCFFFGVILGKVLLLLPGGELWVKARGSGRPHG